MPLKSVTDKRNQLVITEIDHLSVFAVMGTVKSSGLGNVKYYPNPIKPSLGLNYSRMHFANLPEGTTIKIYTVNGKEVRNIKADGSGTAVWDGKNNSGNNAASGVYIVYMEDKSGNKKKIKIAVER